LYKFGAERLAIVDLCQKLSTVLTAFKTTCLNCGFNSSDVAAVGLFAGLSILLIPLISSRG
jgi:hypothetical protein